LDKPKIPRGKLAAVGPAREGVGWGVGRRQTNSAASVGSSCIRVTGSQRTVHLGNAPPLWDIFTRARFEEPNSDHSLVSACGVKGVSHLSGVKRASGDSLKGRTMRRMRQWRRQRLRQQQLRLGLGQGMAAGAGRAGAGAHAEAVLCRSGSGGCRVGQRTNQALLYISKLCLSLR
jgi:hypothetical protein